LSLVLRPYQQQAVGAVYAYLRDHDANPVVVIPTGAGKTPIMATICTDAVNIWQGRVLILAHVRELLEQTYNTLTTLAPKLSVGIFSAGLARKDMNQRVIIAGIQSIYKRAFDFDPFDLVIIDEAHMIPPEGEGMYQSFLTDCKLINPSQRVIGLTATPFRMTTGIICQPNHFLNSICFEIGVKELIVQGYLCPLRTKSAVNKIDADNIRIRCGEFISTEVEKIMDTDVRVKAACSEIVEYTRDRHSVLIFASGIDHGRHIQRILKETYNIECGFVSSESMDGWRKKALEEFKSGKMKYLCNVNVLTTGFDAPNIDCIVLLRPTMSPGLYYQMVGRGFRLHESKTDCLVLDFGGNVIRHGPVDTLRVTDASKRDSTGAACCPAKECPNCYELIHAAYSTCPQCGHIFPPPEKSKHDATATSQGILSGQISTEEYEVEETFYSVHTKKNADFDDPRTMRVQYKIGLGQYVSEWICFEHSGFARHKAEQWWKQRSDESVPATSLDAVRIADDGGIAETHFVTVRHVAGQQYDTICGYKFGAKPVPSSMPEPEYTQPDDDIPF
jgi:DNA repair protein RadD